VETFEQSTGGAPPLDVLLVVDNSASMNTIENALANEAADLFAELNAATDDWRIGILTSDMDDPTQAGRIQGFTTSGSPNQLATLTSILNQGSLGTGDERPFAALLAALDPPLSTGANAGFRRADAFLTIGVFSDEDDTSAIGTQAFVSDLQAEVPSSDMVVYHAFTPPDVVGGLGFGCPFQSALPLAGGAAIKHIEASNLTGGTWTNLCNLNVPRFFGRLVPALGPTGLLTRFSLACAPANPAIEVRVDGALVAFDANDGWTYDASTREVVFHGSAVPAAGEAIEVTYPASASCP
jgi:hypothetical protein